MALSLLDERSLLRSRRDRRLILDGRGSFNMESNLELVDEHLRKESGVKHKVRGRKSQLVHLVLVASLLSHEQDMYLYSLLVIVVGR